MAAGRYGHRRYHREGGLMTGFKWVGSHAQEITGGRVLAPGEYVDLSKEEQEDQHNAALIEGGGFIEAEVPKSTEKEGR
jgi:hypothetical protein